MTRLLSAVRMAASNRPAATSAFIKVQGSAGRKGETRGVAPVVAEPVIASSGIVGVMPVIMPAIPIIISARAICAASAAGVLGMRMGWPKVMRDGLGMLL